MKKLFLFLFSLTLLFSYSIDEANKLIKEKKYKEAIKEYFLIARDGMVAKYNIGYMYEKGLGVKKDIKKAIEFYKMSANDGFAPAALLVGNAYLKGIAVNKNLRKAIYYYEIAAQGGNKEAIKILNAIKKELQKQKKTNVGYVTIRSNVYNDKVFVDGNYVGHTKLTLPLRTGKHTIVVKKDGYKKYETKITIKPKEKKLIKAILKKAVNE